MGFDCESYKIHIGGIYQLPQGRWMSRRWMSSSRKRTPDLFAVVECVDSSQWHLCPSFSALTPMNLTLLGLVPKKTICYLVSLSTNVVKNKLFGQILPSRTAVIQLCPILPMRLNLSRQHAKTTLGIGFAGMGERAFAHRTRLKFSQHTKTI